MTLRITKLTLHKLSAHNIMLRIQKPNGQREEINPNLKGLPVIEGKERKQ
jgi:hypothetical protein